MALVTKSRALIAICTLSFVTAGLSLSAYAEAGKVHTKTMTVTTQESDEDPTPTPTPVVLAPPVAPPVAAAPQQDYLVQKVFGTKAQSGLDGCRTEDLAERVKKDLDNQCHAWMKEQKADLGAKYQTGTCNDDCEDCGMSLKRCKVTGVVHYAK